MVNVAAASLPDWPVGESVWCDETQNPEGSIVAYGEEIDAIGVPSWNSSYNLMRKINVFLEEMEGSPIDTDVKDKLMGQAYFWRAYNYFIMIRAYGGVPYLKKPQSLTDDLFVERNKTSECFDYIVEDLDQAIGLLPDKYTGDEAGKVDKAAAYAFKGRVLLFRASPQFNPQNNATLWNAATTANQEAYTWLINKGYALYPDFSGFWFDELNSEVIFATRYNDPEKVSGRARQCRPVSEIIGAPGSTQPTQELIEAFPMEDGKPINNHPAYSLDTYTENRDPRFYATVVNNGDIWPLSGVADRIQYTYVGYDPDGYGAQWGTKTGYFCRKAVEPAVEKELAGYDETDWVEIRLAEVMLNYAETANMTGDQTTAYTMLKAIRSRAGILPGSDGLFGLKSNMTQTEMLNAIMLERQIELAFEGKRFWDLRRLRWLQDFNGKSRHGLRVTPKDNNDLLQGFTYEVIELDNQQKLHYPEGYYFFPIPENELRNNPNLKQTDGWYEGGFDPLQ
nr:RagB/SusD family nutrient uptake outer membrane protein [Maribellus maritimus]